jgi:hypothetical protein
LVDGAVIEQIGVGIVAVDFHHFGDIAPPRPTLDLDHNLKRIGNVALDGAERDVDTTLEHATGKPGKALFGGIGMNGRERTRVAGVQKLQKVEGFPTSNLAQNLTVRAVAKSGLQEIPNGDARHTVLCRSRLEANEIGMP